MNGVNIDIAGHSRRERIKEFRLKQPRAELERKAKKAAERANLWTQEELDAADAEARDLVTALSGWPE